MRIRLLVLALIVVFILHLTVNANASLVPDDVKIRIPKTSVIKSDITEKRFNEVIERVESVYKPIISKKFGILIIQKRWNIDVVNAFAARVGPLYSVTIEGGLGRHPIMNEDGLTAVVCHELGHHLGGAPKNKIIVNRWSSVEGQSDYFASYKCLRRMFENDDNELIISEIDVDQEVTSFCSAVYSTSKRISLCERISMASKTVALMLASFKDEEISFSTPDRTVVDETFLKHPKAQCRMDTYLQGALCDRPLDTKISKKNKHKGFCSRKDDFEIGVRPLCWFRP